ncbi:MAG: GspE/PulE family protein [Lentisphaeria bacterium]|nr:GspE/PulE family protein [Lentisphaeria bacterium]
MNDLLEQLKEEGLLTSEQVLTTRRRMQRTGQLPEEALKTLNYCSEPQIYKALSKTTGLSLNTLESITPPAEVLEKFPQTMAQQFQCMPLSLEDGRLTVAFAHPPAQSILDQLRLLLGFHCQPVLAPPTAIEEKQQKTYGIGAETVRKIRVHRPVIEKREETPQTSSEDAKDDSVSRLVDEILSTAVEAGATDIHLEPFPGQFRIRFRIDGLLQDIPTPPGIEALGDAIVSRIKVLSRMDIAEKRLPHDGRMNFVHNGDVHDMRVSVIPTRHGETICLRLLNAGNLLMDMSLLGLSEIHLDQLRKQLKRPNGLMLVTGPTGCGKTTTLYSILSHLMKKHPDLKIITVEDPVEYEIVGITQIQIHSEIGLTFSSTLRSILRHDPDVILIGEIRDRETAEMAIQAALTGHLVLSTLHTNDAIGAVNRLINMGIEPDLVASALRCVVAQRLVRRLCPHCSIVDDSPSSEDMKALAAAAKDLGMQKTAPRKALPGGCIYCKKTGYQGRSGIFEIFEATELMEDLISSKSTNATLRTAAHKEGWRPFALDAYRKILLGETDFDEFHRTC